MAEHDALQQPQGGASGPRARSLRTCVGCRERETPARLVRLVRGADGAVRPDVLATRPGRGAWVHPSPGCLELAAGRGALTRALRAPVRVDAARLRETLGAVIGQEIARLSACWEQSGRASGPLVRRLEAMRVAEGELAVETGKRA